MQKIIVQIEWDNPDEVNWLNPGNVSTALRAYCPNTKFVVSEAAQQERAAVAPSSNNLGFARYGKANR